MRSVGSFILQDDHQRLYTLLDDAYHILFRRVASYSKSGLCECEGAGPAVLLTNPQEIQRSGDQHKWYLQPTNSFVTSNWGGENVTLFNGGIVTSQRLGIKKKVTNCITDSPIGRDFYQVTICLIGFKYLQMTRYKLILGDEICNPRRRYEIVFAHR